MSIYQGMILGLVVLGLGLMYLILGNLTGEIRKLRRIVMGKKYTHNAVEGIEDATAVVVDLMIKTRADQARMTQLHEILTTLREGPHAYPRDAVSGERPEGWHRDD